MSCRVVVLVLAVGWAETARAEGYSADIELVRPTFASGSMPGVDDTRAHPREIRIGLVTQYERNPLILYGKDGSRVGNVVGNRVAFDLGASYDLTRSFTVRLRIPAAAQFASSADDYDADGFGVGDPGVGATLRLTKHTAPFQLGLRGDVTAPVGKKLAWLGEDDPRVSGGLVVSGEAGPLGWSAEIGATRRDPIVTENAFTLGPEAYYGAGLSMDVVPDLVTVLAGTTGRVGFTHPFGDGETGFEVLAGGRIHASARDTIDVLVGKGFANGYGTTDFRVVAGYTWAMPVSKKPIVDDEEYDIPDLEPDPAIVDRIIKAPIVEEPDIVPDPPPPKPEEPLAKRVESRIEIRDPIKFYVGTNRVRPESMPTLQAVAALIRPGDLLVIEGRASVEGGLKYNYNLSVSRAQTIYEELLRTGVSPANLAWRALGETSPVLTGTSEAELQESRRVSFYVIPLPGGPPATAPTVTLPWDGTTVPNRIEEKP